MSDLFDLTGKNVLLTGSSRGIGRAMAEGMAMHGANVVISSRDVATCEATAKEINEMVGAERAHAIPANASRKLEVDASDFAQAVDRVATVSSERSRAVKLQLDEDRLVLSVNAPDSGAAEEELAVAYGDDRLEIGFNAKYLLEIASQVDRENAVFLFNSSGDPTLMREGNDESAVYVVMPMRV